MFNTASSEDLGEEQAVLNLVCTAQALHQHSRTIPSMFNTASSEDLGEEKAVLNIVGTTQPLHQHSTTHHQCSILLALRTLGKSRQY